MWIEKQRFRRIFTLALPIMGGMISQNVLNLVDTAMVGELGKEALAAVGLGGFLAFLWVSLIIGISSGVQAMSARRKGAGEQDFLAVPLNAALGLVAVASVILTIPAFFFAPECFALLSDDTQVIQVGSPYLQARVLAIVFAGINIAFRGYWNAVDLPRLYMWNLVITHIINIILNYLLIFGKFGFPAWGATGAGIASSISMAVGSLLYFISAWKYARGNGFLQKAPQLSEYSTLVRLSIPAGIEQFFFAAGFTVLFAIIGAVGTAQLAAANVLINVTLVAILPAIGLGFAGATLVGQALGAKDPQDAKRWGWDVAKVAFVLLSIIGIPMWLTPDLLLGIFIKEPATLEIARFPLQLVGATIGIIETLGMVFMGTLLGAGDAQRVMKVSIVVQWIIYLPVVYYLGIILKTNLTVIWITHLLLFRGLQAILFTILWQQEKWAKINL